MNDTRRAGSMPVFVFFSMLFHALLFLYAPQLVAGLIPSLQPGDQGGLAYVTLVDMAPIEQPRAAVSASARAPQARPEPTARPEPAPETPPAEPPKVEVAPTPAPQAVDIRPQTAPDREAISQPVAEPVPVQVREERPQVVEPVLTAEQSETTIPTTGTPTETATEPSAELAAPATQEAEGEADAPPSEVLEEDVLDGGTGAAEDVASAAPDAELSEESALPPTGISMIRSQGSFIYPKQAVDFLRRTVTVQVAAIVSEGGDVIEVVVVDSSGFDAVDAHAVALASQGITYRPHDETYELRVHVTYNHDERSLSYRVGEFVQAPPTVGSHSL